MPNTIDALVSPKQTTSQRQRNASFPIHRPPLHPGHQTFNAIPTAPLQPTLRLHGEGEPPCLPLLEGAQLPRLRRQVPGRGRVRALHVQHEQARALPGRLLSLLLLLRPEAFQRSVGVRSEIVHLTDHLPSKTSEGSSLSGSPTTGHP